MGKKLSWGTKFGYGFGTFGKSMSYGQYHSEKEM